MSLYFETNSSAVKQSDNWSNQIGVMTSDRQNSGINAVSAQSITGSGSSIQSLFLMKTNDITSFSVFYWRNSEKSFSDHCYNFGWLDLKLYWSPNWWMTRTTKFNSFFFFFDFFQMNSSGLVDMLNPCVLQISD